MSSKPVPSSGHSRGLLQARPQVIAKPASAATERVVQERDDELL